MEWIKVSKTLHTNIKVIMISEALGLDPEAVAYKLIRVWSMADSECTVDKPTISAPQGVFDRLFNCPGLAQAMADVGWLVIHPDCLEFPKFDRHMGKSAKLRMLNSERKRKQRDTSVTEVGQKRDKSVTKKGQQRDTSVTESGQKRDQRRGEEIRGEEKREEESSLRSDSLFAASSAMTPPPSPVLLVFPVDGIEKTWELTQAEVDRLQDLYGGLDVLAECKKAYAWVTASHVNHKTHGGMLKFLTNWLNKATNQTTARSAGISQIQAHRRQAVPLVSETMPPELVAQIFTDKPRREALAIQADIPPLVGLGVRCG